MSDMIIPVRYREAHDRGLRHFLDAGKGPMLNKRIEITVERQDSETTKYSIQVGSFGDEAISREIYEKMKTKL